MDFYSESTHAVGGVTYQPDPSGVIRNVANSHVLAMLAGGAVPLTKAGWRDSRAVVTGLNEAGGRVITIASAS